MDELKPLYQQRDDLNKLIDEIKAKNDSEKADREAKGEVITKGEDGKIERPKDKFSIKIDELYEKKRELHSRLEEMDKKYDEGLEAYFAYRDADEVR